MKKSEDRYGYCDLHLESKLIPYGSHLAGQYGGDKADCNPFEYWRCSDRNCSRCYHSDMYGYFNLDRPPGARIEADSRKQERCGRHVEVPFMVIGKFGEGRRYRCPFKGCDTVGAIVAEFVADMDEQEETPAARTALKGDARKEALELSVFSEFAKAALLPVEALENAKPPCPDIRCRIDGEEYWFELGRITDSMLAKEIAGGWPRNPKPFSFLQEEPFVRIIEKKAKAKYETDGHSVDLVLHFDQQPPDRTAVQRHLAKYAGTLDDLTKRGPFSRVWIYDGWSKSVLWSSAD